MTNTIDRQILDALLDSIGGDRDFLQELIETFLLDAPEQFAALRTALEPPDAATFQRAAHSLKSNAAAFGAADLAALCRQLEEIGKSGDLSAAAALLEQADASYQRAAAALESLAAGGE